ncbi:MOSC domain-containing protein [Flexivirga meconopsidis]|uniref:MOSC domain-containing protein n=1 Tax=Flexivirga meconopsidis TaxID=2977121 RepID=UPI0022408AC2|nr:MOSC domain-containing protein [Flexivirga meconopsidis]
MTLEVRLDAVRVGGVRPLPREGQPSAIDKHEVDGPVQVTTLGLAGDEHGDPRVHGGPEKALHFFSVEGYRKLADALPDVDVRIGSLGENLRGVGATEQNVCVGDVFRLGTALAQVSRPRSPCWKIDHVLDHDGANLTLAELRCQGWYLRVLEEGEVAAGDRMTLVDRHSPAATLDRLLRVQQEHRPDVAELRELAGATGLADQIRRRLLGRAQWLQANPGA